MDLKNFDEIVKDCTIEELLVRLMPYIQQLDFGTRNGKWIAEAFGKDGIHYSSGRQDALDSALIALENKVRKFNIL